MGEGKEFYVVEDETLDAQIGMIPHHVRHWQMWCKEEDEHNYDTDAYYSNLIESYRNGNFQIIVAYDMENFPVGSMCVSVRYEAAKSKLTGWADELYVLPEWRDGKVSMALMEASEKIGRGMGATTGFLGTRHEGLVRLYESYGFKKYMTILRYGDE